MKEIERSAKRLQTRTTRERETPLRCKLLAVTVMMLSSRSDLASMYASSQWSAHASTGGSPASMRITHAQVEEWMKEHGQHASVRRWLDTMSDPVRQQIDMMLIESLVAEKVRSQNAKGVLVPSAFMIATFVRFWRMRPRPPDIDELLSRLEADATYRKHWAAAFHRRWGFQWGALRNAIPIGDDQVTMRAGIFLR